MINWLRLWNLTTCPINIYTQILPLLTLYQYFTTYVCRDLQRAVDGRILKVRVLTDLGLFAEALITLLRLLHGDRLPHIGDSNFRQVESKMPAVMFDNSKPLNEQANLKVRFDWRSYICIWYNWPEKIDITYTCICVQRFGSSTYICVLK